VQLLRGIPLREWRADHTDPTRRRKDGPKRDTSFATIRERFLSRCKIEQARMRFGIAPTTTLPGDDTSQMIVAGEAQAPQIL